MSDTMGAKAITLGKAPPPEPGPTPEETQHADLRRTFGLDRPAAAPAPPARPAPAAAAGKFRSRSALLATVQAAAVRWTRQTGLTSCLYDVNGGFLARPKADGPPGEAHRLRRDGPTVGDGTNGIPPGATLDPDGTITAATVKAADDRLRAAAARV